MASTADAPAALSSAKDASDRMRMKDRPELYHESNGEMKMHVIHFMKQYKSKMNWKQRGDKSIDLGCGAGNTTSALEEFLPPNYEVLVGCDINVNSVRFASETYGRDRIQFRVLDIEGDLPADVREGFDHVFSFYAIQWVSDQEKALRNVFDLLVEGGDCLLLLPSYHATYAVYRALAQSQRWAACLRKVNEFLSPYFDCQEPDRLITEMMQGIGFSYADVKCKQLVFEYSSVDNYKNLLRAVDPFAISNKLMEDFLGDVEAVLRDMRLVHRNADGHEVVRCPYNLLVIHAIK